MKKLKELYEKIASRLFAIVHGEKGQGLIEYALIIVLVALVIFLMLKGTGLEVNKVYSKINSALAQ